MNSISLSLSAPEQNLRRLLMVRGLFLLILCATLTFCYWSLQLQLPYQALLWIISALTLINCATWLQLRISPSTSQRVFFSQLLIDVIAVTLLLLVSGGADNPFVSYYLVPLCIAAATLPKRYVWPLAAIALGCYTSLFFWNIPLPDIAPTTSAHAGHGGMDHSQHSMTGISIHTAGMWFNFLVSAALITYFVVDMAASLRKQDQELAQYREEDLRDEQLLAIATLAAGTAHELGTPLTTIKTLLSEMRSDYVDAPNNDKNSNHSQLSDDLSLLQNQVAHCANTLKELNQRAGHLKDGTLPEAEVGNYLATIVDNWLLLRPEVEATIDINNTQSPDTHYRFHPTLDQAIGNLLNNAADANPKGITVSAHWDTEALHLSIKDCGPGISDELKEKLGNAFQSQKGEGRGLGLFLTHATLNRHGGAVTLSNRDDVPSGTHTQLTLPFSKPMPA